MIEIALVRMDPCRGIWRGTQHHAGREAHPPIPDVQCASLPCDRFDVGMAIGRPPKTATHRGSGQQPRPPRFGKAYSGTSVFIQAEQPARRVHQTNITTHLQHGPCS